MRARSAFALLVFAGLSACGPESAAQAERNCLEQARLAERPRGFLALGAGSGGRGYGGAEITISSDYLMGRDPEMVWENCVQRRSGTAPTRPYSALRN